jgi:hypothetical protein
MERVQVLIDRLAEQKRQNETAAQLLVTVQLLQQELVLLQQQQAPAASKKVSVILPTPVMNFVKQEEAAKPATELKEEKVPEFVQQVAPAPAPVAEVPKEMPAPVQSYTLRRPSITELLQEKGEQKEPAPAQPAATAPSIPHFDVLEETPTLLQHTGQEEKKIHREVNQIIHGEQRSLNDQLKQQKTEVAHLLQETPIKDLRKAIGINDKFLFLNELFNSDEAMYERSIKTINNFHVLQEAEYWINRELKLRLGWNDTKDTVQHFYQLVRRRFS